MFKEIDPNYIERFCNEDPHKESQTSECDEYEYLQHEMYVKDDNERSEVFTKVLFDD